eukprot:m.96573 g.96573  ORF g.96573 m.96573 type:complete len:718 (-) comp10174_c0_seq2:309-2462(-)
MGTLLKLDVEDVALVAQDSPAARCKLASWSARITDMHRSAGVLATTLDEFVRVGHEYQHKTQALAEAFASAGRTFSAGLGRGSSAAPPGEGSDTRVPSPGSDDALTVLSDTLAQIANYQKMLLSQTEELTLKEVLEFRDKTSVLVTRRDKLNEMTQARNQAVAKLCQSSPSMVGNDGADPDYLKRATRAYTAKRGYTRAAVEFATELAAFESDDKVKFLKRMTEQVFIHHGYYKQAAGVFDDASPLATAFFTVLGDGMEDVAPVHAEMLRVRDAAAARAHEEYSANVLALPPQRKVVVPTAPAADKGGLVSGFKRLRQAAKDKMNEVSERKTSLFESAPPPSTAISPQEVTDRVLTDKKEGWVLRREKGTVMNTWKPVYLRVAGDDLIEVDSTNTEGDKVLCNLALLNVRRSEKAVNDRLDCLDLISPHFSMVMQAQGPRDCAEWQLVLSSGIVSAIHGSTNTAGLSDEDYDTLLQLDGNSACAECGDAKPSWCSINLGIMVCLRCSGGHRALGVRFSKVRSAKLDEWSADAVTAMKATGNALSNAYYEHRLPASDPARPTAECSQEDMNAFIVAKYVERRWALPGGEPPGQPASLDDLDAALGSVGSSPEGGTGGDSDGDAASAVLVEADTLMSPGASSLASVDLATPAHGVSGTSSAVPVAVTPVLLSFDEGEERADEGSDPEDDDARDRLNSEVGAVVSGLEVGGGSMSPPPAT